MVVHERAEGGKNRPSPLRQSLAGPASAGPGCTATDVPDRDDRKVETPLSPLALALLPRLCGSRSPPRLFMPAPRAEPRSDVDECASAPAAAQCRRAAPDAARRASSRRRPHRTRCAQTPPSLQPGCSAELTLSHTRAQLPQRSRRTSPSSAGPGSILCRAKCRSSTASRSSRSSSSTSCVLSFPSQCVRLCARPIPIGALTPSHSPTSQVLSFLDSPSLLALSCASRPWAALLRRPSAHTHERTKRVWAQARVNARVPQLESDLGGGEDGEVAHEVLLARLLGGWACQVRLLLALYSSARGGTDEMSSCAQVCGEAARDEDVDFDARVRLCATCLTSMCVPPSLFTVSGRRSSRA